MDRLLPALIVGGITVLALALMWWGWRGRQRRQSALPSLGAPPADAGDVLHVTDAFYVATTEPGNPLERIAVGGLGYRAKAVVRVRERGIELAIPGQDALYVPFALVSSVFRASHVIDRAVERDGLIGVRYALDATLGGSHTVDSYFRIVDPAAAQRFVDEVARRATAGAAQ